MHHERMRTNALLVMALLTLTGTSHAELQGRDLDGNLTTAEAYYDTVLDITWLADANYLQTSGADADGLAHVGDTQVWLQTLFIGDYDDWRLPEAEPIDGVDWAVDLAQLTYDGSSEYGYNLTDTSSELAYMFYVNLGNPGRYTTTGADTGCYVAAVSDCLDNVGPFINLAPLGYGTQSLYNGQAYVVFTMNTGLNTFSNGQTRHWLVHDGDIGMATVPVPEPETYALMLAGLAAVGVAARRRLT